MSEPSIAGDYDDRGARAAHAVLLELGQVLGAHREAMVVIGGSVPSLLMPNADPAHVGTLDIDLDLDPEKLADHGYADLIEKLDAAGYERNVEGLKPFQLRRKVDPRDGGEPIAVIVDLLMPKGARTEKNRPKLVEGLRVQEADGGDVALRNNLKIQISGTMPDGRSNAVELLVASIPALLVMKGYALVQRDKKKDAYDIYFCVRNYPEGTDALAAECAKLLDDPMAREAFANIAGKFDSSDAADRPGVPGGLRGARGHDGRAGARRRFSPGKSIPGGLGRREVTADACERNANRSGGNFGGNAEVRIGRRPISTRGYRRNVSVPLPPKPLPEKSEEVRRSPKRVERSGFS